MFNCLRAAPGRPRGGGGLGFISACVRRPRAVKGIPRHDGAACVLARGGSFFQSGGASAASRPRGGGFSKQGKDSARRGGKPCKVGPVRGVGIRPAPPRGCTPERRARAAHAEKGNADRVMRIKMDDRNAAALIFGDASVWIAQNKLGKEKGPAAQPRRMAGHSWTLHEKKWGENN